MSFQEPNATSKNTKEEFDTLTNRVAVALARRESLIKSWTASSSRPQLLAKSQAELEAEDAALFRNEPAYLGVGAAIPSHFLVSEAERNNRSLRAKFFPTKGLRASKARDTEEKSTSAKRALNNGSSDEEEGRSALGRAKKIKRKATAQESAKDGEAVELKKEVLGADSGSQEKLKTGNTVQESAKTDRGSNVPEGVIFPGNTTEDEYGNGIFKASQVEDDPTECIAQSGYQGESNRGTKDAKSKDRKKMRKREKRKQRRAKEALASRA